MKLLSNKIFFACIFIFFFSCQKKIIDNKKIERNNQDKPKELKIKEPVDSSKYFSLNNDYFIQLYSDKKGNIYRKKVAFLGEKDVNKTKYEFSAYYDSVFTYYDKQNNEVVSSLKEIIDLKTFKNIDDSFYYKDKNHIYYFHPNSDGGSFHFVENTDINSFIVIENRKFDAKDSFHKYYQGDLIEN